MQKLLPIGDLFKKSFELYKPRIWTMLWLGVISWISSIVIFAVFGIAGFTTFALGRNILTFNLFSLLLFLIGVLLVVIINVWIQVAMIYAVKEEHATSSMKNLLLAVRGKMASYYWIVFLRGLASVVGFILFIIPGIIFSVWFCLSQYAFVFEDKKGSGALGRSRQLIKGYWWPVLGRLLILMVIAVLISSISKIGFLINSLFTVPFGIVYLYVIYEDLKQIKGALLPVV